MYEIFYLIQVFYCIKKLYLFEMADCKQYGCHTFSPGGVLL